MAKSVSPKSIGEIVSASAAIQQLRQETEKLQSLQSFISQAVDPVLNERMVVAGFSDDYLVILVESSAWASRIRYLIPLLLEKFAADTRYCAIKSIRIKTQKHDRNDTPPPPSRRASLGYEAAAAIRHTAENLDDGDLAQALKRLAKHAK